MPMTIASPTTPDVSPIAKDCELKLLSVETIVALARTKQQQQR